jgi:hypothetical protein
MPTIDPFQRNRTTQADILLAFSDRLKTISQLNSSNVLITDQPVPENFPGGGYCLTVSPSDGRFDDKLVTGGHVATLCESSEIIVGVYTINLRDRPGRKSVVIAGRETKDGPQLTLERLSIIEWKQKVLAKLLCEDPAARPQRPWAPLDANGHMLLRDEIFPTRSRGPMEVESGKSLWMGIELSFRVRWDWLLNG